MTVTRVLIWLGFLVAVVLLFHPRGVLASDMMIAKSPNGDWLRIYDEPCEVASGWLKLRRAEWFYSGKPYHACWMVVGGAVLVLDDAGEVASLPISAFRKDLGT